MPIASPAKISFPLDIPQGDVLATKQTRDGKFIITVESRHETTKCGVCQVERSTLTCFNKFLKTLNNHLGKLPTILTNELAVGLLKVSITN